MKFSILTPTFNRVGMLKQAVHSVLAQTHTDWELIIKDGSVTNSAIFDREFAELLSDTRIRYIVNKDDGITNALNQALQVATGDIICEMNDDDMLYDNFVLENVEKLFIGFEKEERWMYGNMVYMDENGNGDSVGGGQTTLDALLKANSVCQPTVFWNKIIFGQAGYFDEQFDFAQDYDYWIRLWKIKEPIYYNGIVAKYRLHNNSITFLKNTDQSADAEKVRQKYKI